MLRQGHLTNQKLLFCIYMERAHRLAGTVQTKEQFGAVHFVHEVINKI